MVQNIIGQRERFGKGGFFIGQTEQVLVWNNNQRIHNFLQRLDTLFGLTHAFYALELERFCYNANRQNAHFACCLCNNWCRTGSGAAAHSSGDETHMRAGQLINDRLDAFLGRSSPDRRARAGTQTFGDFDTHLDFLDSIALLQRLRIGVCHHKLDPVQFFFDHVVDRVTTCPANTKNRNMRFKILFKIFHKIQCHLYIHLFVRSRP